MSTQTVLTNIPEEDVSAMQEKRVTNEDLLEELSVLKAQVKSLQEQVLSKIGQNPQQGSDEFLLAEFNELGEFWRHTDARVESTLNLYLTASALIVSSLVFLFQQTKDLRIFITLATVIAIALLTGGIIVTRRIQGTALLKAEYIYGLNLIRRYFVDNDQKIAKYLFLPFDVEKGVSEQKIRNLLSLGLLLKGILVWNSLLFGFICAATAWLIEPRFLLEFLIGTGIVIAVACYNLLSYLTERRIKTRYGGAA